jgi:hypothetical protein
LSPTRRSHAVAAAAKTIAAWLLLMIAALALSAWTTLALAHPYGVNASGGARPDMPSYAADLGARWVRINTSLDGSLSNAKPFLDAGIDVVLTVTNNDPTNIDTTYGTLQQWPRAGFPFISKSVYQQRIAAVLTPLVPYLSQGRRIWVQSENEIGDASVGPSSVFWRGTTDQYLTLLAAFAEEVHALSPSFAVVLTSFASPNLEVAITPTDPRYSYQTQRMQKLLTQGTYDAADGHFYGCVEDIAARIAWLTANLPAGKRWIASEISGPDSQCPTTPHIWSDDQAQFEQLEAQQVAPRLSACASGGASACLWFSLFDLVDETDEFNHLGLIDQRVLPYREKPAYAAYKSFVAAAVVTIPVIEYYNASLDHYFITASILEIAALDGGVIAGWTRTGQSFNAYPAATAGANPVCRYYIPPAFGNSHFYSASPSECAAVQQQYPAFILESPSVFYIALPDAMTGACSAGTIPVYRVWNDRADSNHRYTTDRATRDAMVAMGYIAEGYGPDAVIMCAPA